MAEAEQIAILRIELEEIEPLIWRRVAVPTNLTLARLHETIQGAMGWHNCHLWRFDINDERYAPPSPLDDMWDEKIKNASRTKLAAILDQGVRTFAYVYDFGDDWWHGITVEDIAHGQPNTRYPIFLGGERRCPPEDIGGMPGYYDFLDALAKPRSKRAKELLDWYGEPYDPDDMDEEVIIAALKRIASSRRTGKSKAQS